MMESLRQYGGAKESPEFGGNGVVSVGMLPDYARTCLPIVYVRAEETLDPRGRIRDPKSVEIVRCLDEDFTELGDVSRLRESVAIRTELFDRACLSFVQSHPDAAIVNLGAGLDTRFTRVDNGRITWFDVDLPEAIELRRKFFAETENCRFLPYSVLDSRWMELIPSGRPLLFIAEGLLVYFEEEEVRTLVGGIADSFPGAELLVDAVSPVYLKIKVPGIDPDLTPFKWGVSSFRELEKWHPAILLQNEWFFSHFMRNGYSLFARLSGLKLRSDAKLGSFKIRNNRPLTPSHQVNDAFSLHSDPANVARLLGVARNRSTRVTAQPHKNQKRVT